MATSIIFVTTPTSGSQSMWRLITALTPGFREEPIRPRDGKLPSLEDLTPEGYRYIVRGVRTFKPPIVDMRYRYIFHVRDPRDMLCNQYYWLNQHPAGGQTPEEVAKSTAERREKFAKGIDYNVLRPKDQYIYNFVREVYEADEKPDVIFTSYNQLCCDYDNMVERLVSFLGATPDSFAQAAIKAESPDGLAGNPEWIGQQWVGTDAQPGRYKLELKPETVAELNSRWADSLSLLRAIELPHLRHFYD